MTTTADAKGIILLDWLRLLGWTVEIEREDDQWVGVARPAQASDPELRVGACANGLTKLAWDLFIGAVERVQARHCVPRDVLRAA